jgi:acyl-coenzyme A synthetase/AMP-(fatty) acid ligase
VPPQHSYGFESTVMLALHGHCAAWSGRPFYPADIAAALAAVPRPRLLVTTPIHLKSLLESGIELPPVDRLLSATAPLPEALAREAEQRFAAPLDEIYGSTETGQLATRRTTCGREWQLFQDIRLEQDGDRCYASGGHVEGRIPLGDVIELQDQDRFLLMGRHADMVNIAGKRNSIAHLNHQLNAIPLVEDGVFFLPDEHDVTGVARLCAIVVAPQLGRRELLEALRQRIDPVFLPRPLLFVDRLPRNATGKLTRSSLDELLRQHSSGAGEPHA